ncbi:Amino acid permease [uncultured archaeon]|nr:Amino acid permease [uncultured archaeon]
MKKLGLAATTAVGLGAIIGAGIFVLSGTAIALAGPFALLAFFLVGMVALIMAFVLGELGSMMPYEKGASYSYVYNAFGSELGFMTGILSYFSYATAIAVIGLGFGSYLSGMLGIGASYAPQVLAAIMVFALAVLNLHGMRKAANADLLLVVIKLVILGAFIVFAFVFVAKTGSLGNIWSGADGHGPNSVFEACVAIFFACTGFQTITTFISSVKGGSRTATKAMLLAVLLSTVMYVLVIIALLTLVPSGEYSIVADPLSFALRSTGAPDSAVLLIDVGAVIATVSAALAMLLSASRIAYQISSDGLLPKCIRKFDKKRDVAVNGVILSSAIAILTLFAGNIYEIASISNFGLLFAYIMTCLALMHFRKLGRKSEVKTPLYPYLPLIAIVTMIAFMVGMPRTALIVGVIIMFSLFVAYYLLREVKGKKVIRIRLFD